MEQAKGYFTLIIIQTVIQGICTEELLPQPSCPNANTLPNLPQITLHIFVGRGFLAILKKV